MDDGKEVLSRNGYKVMLNWMHRDLNDLRASREKIEGIPVMGVQDLIDCKLSMGRKKDLADVELLQTYLDKVVSSPIRRT